jgi:hypothetical protein
MSVSMSSGSRHLIGEHDLRDGCVWSVLAHWPERWVVRIRTKQDRNVTMLVYISAQVANLRLDMEF